MNPPTIEPVDGRLKRHLQMIEAFPAQIRTPLGNRNTRQAYVQTERGGVPLLVASSNFTEEELIEMCRRGAGRMDEERLNAHFRRGDGRWDCVTETRVRYYIGSALAETCLRCGC